MKKIFKKNIWVPLMSFGLLFLVPVTLDAAYLETLPGVSQNTSATQYFQNLYALAVSFAGVLAVLFIVIGGLQYIGSAANPSAKENAKKRIWAALGGLLLALASYLILQTINPDLVQFNLNVQPVETAPQQSNSAPSQSSQPGNPGNPVLPGSLNLSP